MDLDQNHFDFSPTHQNSEGEIPFAFSLVCLYCDAGEEIVTEKDAINQGWTEIELSVDLLQANYLGICPVCRRTHV